MKWHKVLTKRFLEKAYSEKSVFEIAREVGCAPGTVSLWLKKYNIPARSRADAAKFGMKRWWKKVWDAIAKDNKIVGPELERILSTRRLDFVVGSRRPKKNFQQAVSRKPKARRR